MRDYAELVKALRCCSKIDARNNGCDSCPYEYCGDDCQNLCGRAADAIEELLKENAELDNSGRVLMAAFARLKEKAPKWISVEDRLPEIDTSVLMCAFGKSVGEGTYRGYDGVHHVWKMYAVAGTYWDDEVTHWMLLPDAPKEDAE